MSFLVESRGTGSNTVVLLHGIPSDVSWGHELATALAPFARVLVPHLPGYGQMPAAVPYDWAQVHGDLVATLAEHHADRPILVGFSGGSWRALELALQPGVGPRGVVCLSGTASLELAERDGFRQFAQALRAGVDLRPLAGPRFLARKAGDDSAVATVQGWLSACPPAALAAELEALAAQPDLVSRLKALDCPVLVRSGTLDQPCPPVKARAIAAACQRGSLELVEGAGHALLLEDSDETIASVTRFVGGLS
ncbi:MAG: alpha/beta hydrolase [Archangium sp.]|nr:alpha/beta hydrolase [Archangium sp.]